jgi:hypothetical protein
MSYQYERYAERPRSSGLRRLVTILTIVVWSLLLSILLIRFVVRPMLTGYLEGRLAQGLISGLIGGFMGGSLPEGSFAISESDANLWLSQNRGEFQGVDDVRVRFLPGQAHAELTMYGLTSTARVGVAVENGQVLFTDPSLGPPLGLIVDVKPFAQMIQNRLNSDMAAAGQQVKAARLEPGRLVIELQ